LKALSFSDLNTKFLLFFDETHYDSAIREWEDAREGKIKQTSTLTFAQRAKAKLLKANLIRGVCQEIQGFRKEKKTLLEII